MSLFKSITFLRIIFFTYLLCVVVLVTSCQNNSDDNAQATMNSDCVTAPHLCQTSAYQNSPGFTSYYSAYGYSSNSMFQYYNNSAYLCNCPAGYYPTYNGYSGLGCVQGRFVNDIASGLFYYSWGANNNHWMNVPQISNYTGYSYTGSSASSSCYNGIVRSCLVTQPNSCGAGAVCQVTQAGSALGLCSSGYGTNSQTTIYR